MTVITHNISAMNAQRQFGINTNNKAKTAEKLSSGYRINRASDDAAGLSISEKMRRQIRGLSQGTENTEAGVSLCQVADGALAEVHDMLHRITELSVKSANGTNSLSDRQSIQDEIKEILAEIDRIGETTSFNEKKIFTGQTYSHVIPAEYLISANNFTVTGTPTDAINTTYKVSANDMEFCINNDKFTWDVFTDGNGNTLTDSPITDGTYSMDYKGMTISIDANQDADMNDIIKLMDGAKFSTKFTTTSDILKKMNITSVNGRMQSVKGDTTNETFTLNVNENGLLSFEADCLPNGKGTLNSHYIFNDDTIAPGTYHISLDYGNGGIFNELSFDLTVSEEITGEELKSVLNGATLEHYSDYFMEGVGSDLDSPMKAPSSIFATVSSIVLEEQGINPEDGVPFYFIIDENDSLALQVGDDGPIYHYSNQEVINSININYRFSDGNGHYIEFNGTKGGFKEGWRDTVANQTVIQHVKLFNGLSLEDTSHWEYFTGITPNPVSIGVSNIQAFNDSGYKGLMVKPTEIYSSVSGLDIWIQSGNETMDGISLEIEPMNTKYLGINDLNVTSIEGAEHAMTAVEGALEKLSANRSKIGAQQNRLEHTIRNQENTVENTTASESRIRDADMADLMVQYAKENILEQAGHAMITQANQSTSGILNLLQ